jgi:hypothetical protein
MENAKSFDSDARRLLASANTTPRESTGASSLMDDAQLRSFLVFEIFFLVRNRL